MHTVWNIDSLATAVGQVAHVELHTVKDPKLFRVDDVFICYCITDLKYAVLHGDYCG